MTDLIQKINFEHSIKNIPYCSKSSYFRKLISSSESFFNRLHSFANIKLSENNKTYKPRNNFGLKSHYKSAKNEVIAPFENEWWEIVKNIKFKNNNDIKCKFQKNLKKDLKTMTNGQHIIVNGDKSTNLYKVDKPEYLRILSREIHKHYKKCDESIVESIENDLENFSTNFGVSDRVSKIVKSEAFCSIKDHKEGWERTLPARLINPCKTDLGVISKSILDRILKTASLFY